jgi:signal transduction histidine kinase
METPVNILLVDDKMENLLVLESILEGAGYRLTKARSAQEALAALLVEQYALIVLDVRMPETSGFELATIIKERKKTRDIPIIFVTAHYAEDQHVLSGYTAGAVDYLTKPINPQILRSKVAVFAELHRKTRALDEANRVLQLRNEELLAANQELEAFSYTISHDLRGPLRHMHMFVGLLREDVDAQLSGEARGFLDRIQASAAQMGQLIDHFLTFARLGRAQLQAVMVDMNELFHQALDRLQPDLKGRRIEWRVAPLPGIGADPTLMLQVWVNLLSNAIKYTRPREAAVIEIGCDESRREEVAFFVRDNGIGFSMDYADKLFGVFERLHHTGEFEGTGIGLAIVRRIIQRHEGRTWAEGKPGAGATFWFSLSKAARLTTNGLTNGEAATTPSGRHALAGLGPSTGEKSKISAGT